MTEDTQEHRITKLAYDLTVAFPSLQPILSWNVTGSPLSRNHYVNINKANMHLFTSNEAWNEVANPIRSQSAEALTEGFYKKNPNFFKICHTSDIKKHFP